MKRIASVSFFGIALAVVLSFGIPGNANAFDNGTSGRIILAGVGQASILEALGQALVLEMGV